MDEAELRKAALQVPVFLAVDQHNPAGCAPYFAVNQAKLRSLGFRVTTYQPAVGQHWATPAIKRELFAWLGG